MAYEAVKEHTTRRASAETRLEIVLYLLRILIHDCADGEQRAKLAKAITWLVRLKLAD